MAHHSSADSNVPYTDNGNKADDIKPYTKAPFKFCGSYIHQGDASTHWKITILPNESPKLSTSPRSTNKMNKDVELKTETEYVLPPKHIPREQTIAAAKQLLEKCEQLDNGKTLDRTNPAQEILTQPRILLTP